MAVASDEIEYRMATLCRFGAWSALILLIYSLVTMLVLLGLGAALDNAQACFEMIQQSVARALLRLDILTVFAMPVFCLLYAALFGAMRKQCYVAAPCVVRVPR